MPIDPDCLELLSQLEALNLPDFSKLEPAVVRKLYEAMEAPPGEPVSHVSDRTLPGPDGEIPVRVYAPESDAVLPALVYLHGGGWVLCSLDTHDGVCRSLANAARCVVVSVDYRLAPEHKFPAGAEDCYAALRWVAEKGAEIGVDPARIAIGGDSAGGNLSAVVALMARDRGGPALRHQLLVYPVIARDFETPSYRENAEGKLLTREQMVWFWNHYLAEASQAAHPYVSPIRAESLAGLPPALVITAEFDPLRDEGEAYAERLREAGVPTRQSRYDGMIHGFFSMGGAVGRSRVAVDEAAGALRDAFR